jgi:hypothetical protein
MAWKSTSSTAVPWGSPRRDAWAAFREESVWIEHEGGQETLSRVQRATEPRRTPEEAALEMHEAIRRQIALDGPGEPARLVDGDLPDVPAFVAEADDPLSAGRWWWGRRTWDRAMWWWQWVILPKLIATVQKHPHRPRPGPPALTVQTLRPRKRARSR